MHDIAPRSRPSRRAFIAGGAAACLAGCASPARQAEHAETQWPATGRFAEVEGLRVHYVQEGLPGGPEVVLIHGAALNLRDMTFMTSWRLAQAGYRVTSFDRPGMGYSDRPAVDGWRPATQARILRGAADAIGIGPRASVLGHCFGASVALAWGLQAPDRTRAIICISGLTMPEGEGGGTLATLWGSKLATAMKGVAARAAVGADGGERAAAHLFRPQAVPAGYLNHVGGPLTLRLANFNAVAEDLDRLPEALEEQVPLYPSLTVPTRILHGTADTIAPAAIHAEALAALLPTGEAAQIDGIGHMLHHAAPDALIAALRE